MMYRSNYTVQVTSVGAVDVEGTISVPYAGTLRRVYAAVSGGTGSPTVSLKCGGVTTPTGADVVYQAAGSTGTIDAAPDVPYRLPDVASAAYYRTLFVAVSTSDPTTDHTVDVTLEIESPDKVY